MPRLGRVRARLLLALKPLPTHLGPTNVHSSTKQFSEQKTRRRKKATHLALQIERGSVRIRAFSPQLRRERTQRIEHALALSADRRNDARAELLWRAGLRSEHRGVVVDAGVDEQRAALARAGVIAAGAEGVDAAGLDVDARNLGSVVGREYGELDGAAPGVRREDGADVFVARAPFSKWGVGGTTRNTAGK